MTSTIDNPAGTRPGAPEPDPAAVGAAATTSAGDAGPGDALTATGATPTGATSTGPAWATTGLTSPEATKSGVQVPSPAAPGAALSTLSTTGTQTPPAELEWPDAVAPWPTDPAAGRTSPSGPAGRASGTAAGAGRFGPTGRLARVWRGRPDDPRWARPALLALLAGTAVLYIVGLGASGWANAFYSAAVQAGSTSWKAFFFGSSDASNFITVDKPPASLWVMDISARIFGLNSWSLLVPQALEGVAAVGVLYATVRRWFTPGAALIAGAVFALTPVAALMFRFNNPDALLILLLVLGAYALTRAVENGRTGWLLAAGAFVGTGFIAKMMQTFLVVPAFAVVYLVAAPTPLRKRVIATLAAGLTMLVAAGWWVAVVALVPASDRPYIGGSQNNSILNLIFGYNGFGRLSGNEAGSVGGGGAGGPGGGTGSRWGATGLFRMFNSEMGGQISWLLPAALILLVAGVWASWRAPRTDRTRAAMILWGGWLLVTGLTFSFAQGIIHPYYTVALAPAIGALVGIGGAGLWRQRAFLVPRAIVAGTIATTAIWSYVLLRRTPDWHPALRVAVLVVGILVAVAIVVAPYLRIRRTAEIMAVLAAAGILAGVGAPAAYALDTASSAHTGAIPSAGPAGVGGFGGPGGFGRRSRTGGQGTFTPPGTGNGGGTGTNGNGQPQFSPGGGFGGGGTFGGGAGGGLGGNVGGRGGAGGLLDASTPSAALVAALRSNAGAYTWVAATTGSNSAAGLQLASRKAVMAIGGFNGTDPTPTLAQFEAYVRQGKIHYYVSSGLSGGGFGGRASGGTTTSDPASQISAWVAQNFTATTIGGTTVYDLTTTAVS
ncbi:MAG: glycosyltransferase family 39 protein [Frankia sp.]